MLVVHALLAAAFTATMIQHSRSYGRLLVGPLYDDVVYLSEGLLYTHLAQAEGLWAALGRAVERPPHSPFATATAAASFVLLGPVEWAPYALMGVVVLAVLLAADWLLGGLPAHARVAGALFALGFPIVGTLPYHFRPDATAGLVTALGVVMMLRRSPFHATRRHQLWTGLCFAAALLVKTSVLPFTLYMFVGSWALSALAGARIDLAGPGGAGLPARRGAARRWAAVWPYWLPVLVVAGPYYALAGRQVHDYIYENVFGRNREMWRMSLTWTDQARFLWDGAGGGLMVGRHGYLVVALGALAALLHLGRGRAADRPALRAGLGMIGALLLAWLLPTASGYDNPFIGATFAALLLFAGVMLLRGLFVFRPLGAALGWAAVLLGLLAFQLPPGLGTRSATWVVNDNRIERAVYRAIVEHADGSAATVFVTNAGNLNADLLQFRARADQAALTFHGAPLSGDLHAYRGHIAASDYVVAGDQGAFRENSRLPGHPLQDALVAMLAGDPGFSRLATVPTPEGLSIYVFGRKAAFGGWVRARGLGPLEGPFPEAGDRMIRRGRGPVTSLTVVSTAARAGVIALSGVGIGTDQVVDVVVNGRSQGRTTLEQGIRFRTVELPVTWREGENRVDLRYTSASAPPPAADVPTPVAFKVLRVE
jgi:hypothetical protein